MSNKQNRRVGQSLGYITNNSLNSLFQSGRSAIDIRPKILLKPESSQQQQQQPLVQTQSHPHQPVYIASQEFVNRSITVAQNPNPVKQASVEPHIETKELKSCIDLITTTTVNPDVQEYLRENSHFRATAVLGRGVQKDCVLNTLLDKHPDVFPGDSSGLQLFITKDRQFALNVNLDQYRRARSLGREGDVEMLMLYITLLKTCHTLIFVEPQVELLNCIRLLRSAELMDFGYDKLGLNSGYLPKVLFLATDKETPSLFIETLLKGSRLQENVQVIGKSNANDNSQLLQSLLKLAYRSPRTPMFMLSPFTELHWFQLVQSLWKLHKTNYFLVKYVKGSSFQ